LLPNTEKPTAVHCVPLEGLLPIVSPDIDALLEDVSLLIVPAVKLQDVPIDPENVPVLELISPEYVPPVNEPVRVLAVNV
jgi:hypothetical protein